MITVEDQRWARCDIKTVALLPNCMAKQAARAAGAYEAFMLDRDGMVTEGSSTNAWIVSQDGHLITRPVTDNILNGVTRLSLMAMAAQAGLTVEERAFSGDELKQAREVFLTSSSGMAIPVVRVDDRVIGNGQPGSITGRIIDLFDRYVESEDVDAAAGRLQN